MSENRIENPKPIKIFALATDPIYIGTGGYTIGRVDNTIVRDPITNIPKIPGSSLAGTWRYYVALEAIYFVKNKIKDELGNIVSFLKEEKAIDEKEENELSKKKEEINTSSFNELKKSISLILNIDDNEEKKKNIHNFLAEYFKTQLNFDDSNWKSFKGNRFLQITCAGQDNIPQEELANSPYATNKEGKTGHCGHCIVCKGFGFSKKDISWQGQIFFSDLNILFFPVFTARGTKWITTKRILQDINDNEQNQDNLQKNEQNEENESLCFVFEKVDENIVEGFINLGWLYLPYKFEKNKKNLENQIKNILKKLQFQIDLFLKDIIIVPESLFSHIVNSNLEVRTSVSIDPITGAAKEGALFTSEAIPRGTIFYGNIRIFDKSAFDQSEEKLQPLPSIEELQNALEDSKHYYESLGIGGMTTRGFGRLKIKLV